MFATLILPVQWIFPTLSLLAALEASQDLFDLCLDGPGILKIDLEGDLHETSAMIIVSKLGRIVAHFSMEFHLGGSNSLK